MIAFELSNAEGVVCTAGSPDSDQAPLSLIITNAWGRDESGALDGFVMKVHGYRREAGSENVTWQPNHRMRVGDELVVRLVDVPEVEAPTEVKPARKGEDVHPRCAFCGATKEEALGMIYGREAAICPGCVDRFHERRRYREDPVGRPRDE